MRVIAKVAGWVTVVAHPVGARVGFDIVCPVQLEDGTALVCRFRPGEQYPNLNVAGLIPGRKIEVERTPEEMFVRPIGHSMEAVPAG